MENIRELIEGLHLDSYLTIKDIPELDLYMDQVIQLFEKKYADTKRSEDDKVLTKTMINNYAKGKLFFPVKNKKYTKEHIMLISMIYQMKSALSINDIKKTLDKANTKITEDAFDLENFYESYENTMASNIESFKEQIHQEAVTEIEGETEEALYRKQLLMVASFTHMSNLYRRAAEKIVDEMEEEVEKSKKEK